MSRSYGRNCPQQFPTEEQCLANGGSRLQPDPEKEPGYTATEITAGPNQRYWMVTNMQYNMRRVANVHPGMLITSPRIHPVPKELLTKECKLGLGVNNAKMAIANMNQVNQHCGLSGFRGTDMATFVPAIWGHEGFGYAGGVGHETLGQAAAGEPQNDPYSAIENFVFASPVTLANAVKAKLVPIRDDIRLKAADNNPVNGGPKGNYSPPPDRISIYFWEPDLSGTHLWKRYVHLRTY
jgi:hypothetical protein